MPRGDNKDRIHDPYSWATARIRATISLALTREGSMNEEEALILRRLEQELLDHDPHAAIPAGAYDVVLRLRTQEV